MRPKNNEYSIIFPTRKLLHEFIVDVWVTTKQAWLHWVKMNEAILKAYIYQGLGDTIFGNAANEEIKLHNLECRVILPSFFMGSFHNMSKISRFYGHHSLLQTPNLLGLMITNLEWLEIKST